ncbi:phosphoenolpyruvate-utilizing protein [Gordonia jinghuaiqii]|uniref:Phosphoenolpyruvate-utilizing protein n=1 Tax=Gordonia jinghuaiqii TaxID=2758710 RepID=A0A7D7LY42_9ACTN|nr:PEP-utilizing enzyme [Gordonia jinghuaiqii]MCR5980579.1 phosphoenolpyruvate-utilizing protein [Gordonia jinghuaiqii]QMT02639.1 phosphoenolpyruvate-utilizing protein [Gordonia jinghuaiqii]
MVDITQPFVIDTPLSTRFPIYTRANTGEVAGGTTSPLMWSFGGGMGNEIQWRKALAEFGAFDEDEFREDFIDIQGMVHGYIYLNLSQSRVFGVRMPGATPDLMDRTYLGDVTAPPYVPHPDDAKPEYTDRILASVQRVMTETHRNDIEIEDREAAAQLRAVRPDMSAMSDRELLEHAKAIMADRYPHFLRKHLKMVYESSVVTGALDELAGKLGDATLTIRLTGGQGNVASAVPSQAMWDLSRLVAASPALTAAFDAGVDGLEGRLRASGDSDVVAFVAKFDEFLYEHGSRSTDEWAPMPKTWETHRTIPLGMIDRLRFQDEAKNPRLQSQRVRRERDEVTSAIRAKLADDPEALAGFDAVLATVDVYMPARERSKTNTIRVLQECRMPLFELGRRFVERGVLSRADDLTMLLVDELDKFIDDPAAYAATIDERREWSEQLSELEPPFIIDGEIPPVTTWSKKKAPAVNVAVSGDVLTGIGACPGVAEGIARVIFDPEDAPDLEPGEILVAPVTDPGWTPIFTSAEAVVVNVGSPLSHAAIVSRELGMPCVLAVKDATKRIVNGTKIAVDGTNGTVTIL